MKKGLIILAIIILAITLSQTVNGEPAKKPFDHSYCQYPARSTNPPDGCDNSDPCDPANVKGGSGACERKDQPKESAIEATPIAEPEIEVVGGK